MAPVDELAARRALLVRAAAHDDPDVADDALAELVDTCGSAIGVVAWARAGGEQRLLPLLGNRRELVDRWPDLAEACATATAESWGLNERLCSQVAPVVAAWRGEGIDVVALKGMALAWNVYPMHALRPVGDADLYVPQHQARTAVAIARSLGWSGREAYWRWFSGGGVAKSLGGPTGGSIDLHIRPGRAFRYGPRAFADLVDTSVPLSDSHPLASTGLRQPSPVWLAAVVASHGANPVNAHIVHWMVDLHLLVTGAGLDVADLARLADRQVVARRCARALAVCRTVLDTPLLPQPTGHGVARRARAEERAMALEAFLADDRAERSLSTVHRTVFGVRHDTPLRGPWAMARVGAAAIGNGRRLRPPRAS